MTMFRVRAVDGSMRSLDPPHPPVLPTVDPQTLREMSKRAPAPPKTSP